MPFSRDVYLGRFTPEELNDLQSAYLLSCERLNRCAITSPFRDEMAREITQIFECGIKDPARIAEIMVKVASVKHSQPRETDSNSTIAPPKSL